MRIKGERSLTVLSHGSRALPLLLLATLIISCESATTVSIDGKVPPTFEMTGSGEMVFFIVREISPDNQKLAPAQRDSRKDSVLWQIAPDALSSSEKVVSRLPGITYAVVPKGFVQKRPESDAPPALVEGKVYEAGGPATNAQGGFVWFTIRGGKTIQVEEPTGQ